MIKNKKILIVGGTGFIGFNLAKKLNKNNYIVSISTKKPSIHRNLKNVKYVILDVSNFSELSKINKYDFDFVINLAGYVNHKEKIKTYRSHFIGAKNLINYFKLKKIEFFLQVGSCTEYGHIKSPHLETSRLKLSNLKSYYSIAKLKASKLLINEIEKKNLSGLIIRPYLVYGPGQDFNRLVPVVFKNCILKKIFDCSEGKQKRNFLFIDDLIIAIINILKVKPDCKIMNIGSNRSYKVKTIINKIKLISKGGKPIFGKVKLRPDEPKEMFPNLINLQKYLKWNEKFDINKGLKKTLIYYKKYVG